MKFWFDFVDVSTISVWLLRKLWKRKRKGKKILSLMICVVVLHSIIENIQLFVQPKRYWLLMFHVLFFHSNFLYIENFFFFLIACLFSYRILYDFCVGFRCRIFTIAYFQYLFLFFLLLTFESKFLTSKS